MSIACNLSTFEATSSCSDPFAIDGKVSPSALPRLRPAPIALRIAGGFDASSPPPAPLSKLTIEFDRQGAIDTEGLPVCGKKQLVNATWEVARRVCRSSIVGSGTAKVDAAIPGQAVESGAPVLLTVFNGGTREGVSSLFIDAALVGPIPTTVVATEKIKGIDDGQYGHEAVTTIPPVEHELVRRPSFELRIHRHRFVSVRCRKGSVAARTTGFTLGNGEAVLSRAAGP